MSGMCKISRSSKAKKLSLAGMITSQSISCMINSSHVVNPLKKYYYMTYYYYISITTVYQFLVSVVSFTTNNSLDLEEFASCSQLPRFVCKRTLGIGASPSGCIFTWAMPSCNECWHLFDVKGHWRSMINGEN